MELSRLNVTVPLGTIFFFFESVHLLTLLIPRTREDGHLPRIFHLGFSLLLHFLKGLQGRVSGLFSYEEAEVWIAQSHVGMRGAGFGLPIFLSQEGARAGRRNSWYFPHCPRASPR